SRSRGRPCRAPPARSAAAPLDPDPAGVRRGPAPAHGGEPEPGDPPVAPARPRGAGARPGRGAAHREPALAGHVRRAARRGVAGRLPGPQPGLVGEPLPQPAARGPGHDAGPGVRRRHHAVPAPLSAGASGHHFTTGTVLAAGTVLTTGTAEY